eukprot:CAMPEP_0119390634 /NCGR_PEP_ID=MMETSP1334-20130426/114102_1 /TAXON_ID=127549 /ORGANISM="Calcidiscus leptoporus, Strain RCC1130" /LENGTH=73 /DNA_ID=CAMNT_0007413177 /DNA_START=230 /DNA_END=447 /DNA_ORIENTATION=+
MRREQVEPVDRVNACTNRTQRKTCCKDCCRVCSTAPPAGACVTHHLRASTASSPASCEARQRSSRSTAAAARA